MGDYGMSPFEFYQLSMQEVIWIQRGNDQKQTREFNNTRFIAYYSAFSGQFKGVKFDKFHPIGGNKLPMTKAEANKIIEAHRKAVEKHKK